MDNFIMSKFVVVPPRYYILVGDEETWMVALESQQWGFTEKTIGNWKTIHMGELVAFYVTNPTKKIIGFAEITKKFISNDLLWPDEKLFKRSLWPYRLQFEIISMIKDWNDGINPPTNILFNVGRRVIDKKIFESLLKNANKKWNVKMKI